MGGEGERVVAKRSLGIRLGNGLLLVTVPASVMADEQASLLQDVTSSIRYQDPTSGDVMPVMIDCRVLVRLEAADDQPASGRPARSATRRTSPSAR